MSTVVLERDHLNAVAPDAQGAWARVSWWVADTIQMVKRNFFHVLRTPEMLIDVTFQPIIFVLLFRYVFGGAIDVPGESYVNYLMAGIFVQTMVFSMIATGIFLASDLEKGLINRFRSLPMSHSAILSGRTVTDILRAFLAIVIMVAVGLTVGFRPDGSPLGWLAALGLMLLFGFAIAWVGVTVGMLVRTSEAAQGAMFIAIFPLTFASSAFVPTDSMPHWLRVFTEHQPMSVVVNAVRSLILDQPVGSDGWQALAWSLGLLVIFFPLAIELFERRTTK